MKKLFAIPVLLAFLISCGLDDPNTPMVGVGNPDIDTLADLSNSDFNILFIGNSLTYTNDLPILVQLRAKQINLDIGVRMIAFPNFAIIDHWQGTWVHEEISSGKYDYVVVQQGPSSQAFGREVLIEYGAKFKAECSHYGSELAFFMVWPSLDFYHTFDGVIKNYSDAAALNESILLPVGQVWKDHFDATDDFSYYGGDGFHPSLRGSEVAADVIVRTLFP